MPRDGTAMAFAGNTKREIGPRGHRMFVFVYIEGDETVGEVLNERYAQPFPGHILWGSSCPRFT